MLCWHGCYAIGAMPSYHSVADGFACNLNSACTFISDAQSLQIHRGLPVPQNRRTTRPVDRDLSSPTPCYASQCYSPINPPRTSQDMRSLCFGRGNRINSVRSAYWVCRYVLPPGAISVWSYPPTTASIRDLIFLHGCVWSDSTRHLPWAKSDRERFGKRKGRKPRRIYAARGSMFPIARRFI